MIDYTTLSMKYSVQDIQRAIKIAQKTSVEYPESYCGDADFLPHLWVVAAICEALKGKP